MLLNYEKPDFRGDQARLKNNAGYTLSLHSCDNQNSFFGNNMTEEVLQDNITKETRSGDKQSQLAKKALVSKTL